MLYTKRLADVLVNRAKYLARKQFKGGRQRLLFYQQIWTLKLRPEEIGVSSVLQANDSLRQQVDVLKEQNNSLEKQVDCLTCKNISLQSSMSQLRGCVMPAPAKPISDYSKSHQRSLKRKRTQSCEASLEWLKEHGKIPTQVTVQDVQTGVKETIDVCRDDVAKTFGDRFQEEDENDFDKVNMILLIKDTYNVSGNAYHEFAKIAKEMPRHYRLKRRISQNPRVKNLLSIVPILVVPGLGGRDQHSSS